jgi:thiamine-monophosphate kinase
VRGRIELDGPDYTRARLAMEQPTPRVALGCALRGVASSAIDLSDGLLGDLDHLLRRSGARCQPGRAPLGAEIEAARLPCHPSVARQPQALQLQCLLGGGDDYELLFSAPPSAHRAVLAAGAAAQTAVTRIGRIDAEPGVRVRDAHGALLTAPSAGFDHFSA